LSDVICAIPGQARNDKKRCGQQFKTRDERGFRIVTLSLAVTPGLLAGVALDGHFELRTTEVRKMDKRYGHGHQLIS
jgi:hypothetical protein